MTAFLTCCRFAASSSGTGDFVVSAAVTGYQTPALAGAVNSAVYPYRAESADLSQWEVGYGTYTTGTVTLARTTVLWNSSGTGSGTGQSGAGTKISFSAAPQVAVIVTDLDVPPVDVPYIVSSANGVLSAERVTTDSDTVVWDDDTAGQIKASAVLRGHIDGLNLSTAGSSATFAVAAGQATDSANAQVINLASSISKGTGSWAVGTGNGALDTGSIANSTWYHVYLIRRPDTGVVDVLISTSATSPTMPTNYTQKRRIGSMKTDGSAQWLLFVQSGDLFKWGTAIQERSSTAAYSVAALSLGGVPTGAIVQPILVVDLYVPSGANVAVGFGDAGGPGTSPTVVQCAPSGGSENDTSYITGGFLTDTSANIYYIVTINAGSITSNILSTRGWIDARGRNA